MPVNGIELKEGQRWRLHNGAIVTLKLNSENTSSLPWKGYYEDGETWSSYTEDGRYYIIGSSVLDLTSLVSEANPELTYTEAQIRKAYENWSNTTLEDFLDTLRGTSDPEYLEYLRLKDKFEGK